MEIIYVEICRRCRGRKVTSPSGTVAQVAVRTVGKTVACCDECRLGSVKTG